jgi:hypothetical protein
LPVRKQLVSGVLKSVRHSERISCRQKVVEA